MLRYAGTESATFWVETSAPCEVEILGHAHLDVRGRGPSLRAGARRRPDAGERDALRRAPRRRALSGRRGRTTAARRPHTRTTSAASRLVFGSCRVGDPQPTNLERDVARRREDARDRRALDVLEAAPARRDGVARRRPAPRRPGLRRRGLARDARLHPRRGAEPTSRPASRSPTSRSTRGSTASRGRDPDIRWLLSTVPTAMIFDDHDVHDDWNISVALGRGDAPEGRGGRRASPAPSWPTGSTSTSATSRRPSSPRKTTLRAPSRATTTRAASAAARAHVGPRVGGEPLGLLPRLRRHAPARGRLARRARARRRHAAQMIDDEEWDWIVEHSTRRASTT